MPKKPASLPRSVTPSLRVKEGAENVLILKDGSELPLVHNNGSLYRLSSLPGGIPPARNLGNPRTAYAAALGYAWAMLPKSARPNYQTPEDFAELVGQDDIGAVLQAVTAALVAYAKEEGAGDTLGNG